MAQERIQKVLAEQGLCSRRAAEQIIREGRVKVNGHPVTLGDKMDPHQDILSVDGQRIYIQRKREFYYYMLKLVFNTFFKQIIVAFYIATFFNVYCDIIIYAQKVSCVFHCFG